MADHETNEKARPGPPELTSPQDNKKIILLYASAGAGHRSACEAVKHSILEIRPSTTLKMVDILDYMPSGVAKLYSGGYILIASRYPMLWYLIYESGSDLSRFRPSGYWHRIFWQTILNSFFHFLRKEKPDQIISSHFLASWAAGTYKRKYNPLCTVSSIVTDYGVHPVWIVPSQDKIFVATEQLKAELLPFSQYLGTDNIQPVGIPIHPKFNIRRDISAMKRKYQLEEDRKTILVLGGMFNLRNLKDVLFWLGESTARLQILVVAGRHYPLTEDVKARLAEKDIKCQSYGHIDFMEELMAISDLAITKAGALTTSECLASGLPMIIFKPYPGQEVRNCDYFLEKGAAVRVDQVSGLCHKMDSILLGPGCLTDMRERTLAIARPDSSRNIASILLNS